MTRDGQTLVGQVWEASYKSTRVWIFLVIKESHDGRLSLINLLTGKPDEARRDTLITRRENSIISWVRLA